LTRSHRSLLLTLHRSDASTKQPSVDLKRRPPKSLPGRFHASLRRREKRPARTPPSTFLFLPIHLSNSQKPPHPTRRREHGHEHGPMLGHRVNSEGLRGRANAPKRRRAQEDLYRVRLPFLSTFPTPRSERSRQFLPVFATCPVAIAATGGSLPERSDTGHSPVIRK
jgi:hypothetical protein